MKNTGIAALMILTLVACTTSAGVAPNAPASRSSKVTASATVTFDQVTVTNTQGIPATVTIEAPIGTVVSGPQQVGPNATLTLRPGTSNVSSAKVTADYGQDHGSYSETVTLTGNSTPLFIRSMAVYARIGDVVVTELTAGHEAF